MTERTQKLKETTDWVYPNHTYIVNGNSMSAYIKQGTEDLIVFKKPIPFYRKGRTFKEVK